MKMNYVRSCFALFLVAALVAAPVACHATPILYTVSGTASGTLGGVAFTDSAISITEAADTGGVSGGSGFLFDDAGTSTLTIAGVGSATFTSSSFGIMDYQAYDALGFYDASTGFGFGGTAASFATYNLQSALSPVIVAAMDEGTQAESTSRGSLVLSSVSGNATVSATSAATPESGTLVLVSMGALSAAGAIRRQC